MLQQAEPGDYVIATGETHTVRELCRASRSRAVGTSTGRQLRRDRPAVLPSRRGGPPDRRRDARRGTKLGWPPKTSFGDLIRMMVAEDLLYEQSRLAGRQSIAA